jgi:hypothetical protein
LDYGDKLYEKFEVQWFSFTGYYLKDSKLWKPWHWSNCNISFEKVSDDTIRFMVRREKEISLSYKTKMRWDAKQKSTFPGKKNHNNYMLHYVIHFDVQISSLPKMINEEKIEEQLHDKKEYGDIKDSWVLYLDTHHKIWTWKDNEKDTKNIMIKILESINKKVNNEHISPNAVDRGDSKINMDIQPVVYPVVNHPTRDLGGRNYIQEIHLHRSKMDNKILVTIVYNDERLREHAWLDYIYRIIRKLRHGRTFDVESFSIVLDKNGYPRKFEFPDIYSGDNKLEKDNIHCNKCDLDIRYYFNQEMTRPILFINTSNHAMAEMDNNCNKWKIEYRLWDEQCPIYMGTNTRCEIEKYLSKHGIEPLFHKCNDSKVFSCNE